MQIVLCLQIQSTNKTSNNEKATLASFGHNSLDDFLNCIVCTTAADGETAQMAFSEWLLGGGGQCESAEKNTIYFYNTENTMVYKETVEGVRLHLDRTKTLMRLKNVLDQSVTAWQKHHVSKENQALVATAFGR